VLSEIAARALSPAVNDPGTAIVIIGRFVRLFACWARPLPPEDRSGVVFDRVIVPGLELAEMFDDAFAAIARDGANDVQVGVRLQKAFISLSGMDYPGMRREANRQSNLALKRAKRALTEPEDVERVSGYAKLLE
jgi:uncharacterized membrane protein